MQTLSPDATAALFINHLSISHQNGGMRPRRFTPQQDAVFSAEDRFRFRSQCPAGIALGMRTDASAVFIRFTAGEFVRDWCSFNLVADGRLADAALLEPVVSAPAEVTLRIPGPAVMREVTVYLPHTVVITITSVAISDGATAIPLTTASGTVLCIGDSITQGMDGRQPWSMYPSILGRVFGLRVVNQGLGGYVFEAESVAALPQETPRLITVAYGTNDWCRSDSAETFAARLCAFLDRLRGVFPAVPTVVLTPLWRGRESEIHPCGTLDDVRRRIAAEARARGMDVIDGRDLVPNHPHWFSPDQVHPNDTGLVEYGLNLARRLAPALTLAPTGGFHR